MLSEDMHTPDNTLSDPDKYCKELQPGLLIFSHCIQCYDPKKSLMNKVLLLWWENI